MNRLVVPDPLSGFGIESQKTVGIQIVANAIASVEIESRGSQWRVDNAALLVDGQPRPCVHTADILPGVARPSNIAELSRMRDGVKRPLELAATRVISAYVAGQCGQCFAHDCADN